MIVLSQPQVILYADITCYRLVNAAIEVFNIHPTKQERDDNNIILQHGGIIVEASLFTPGDRVILKNLRVYLPMTFRSPENIYEKIKSWFGIKFKIYAAESEVRTYCQQVIRANARSS